MKTFLPSVEAFCVLKALRRADQLNKSSGPQTHVHSHPAFPSNRGRHLLTVVCAVSALVFVCADTGLAQDLKIGFVDLEKFALKSVKAHAMQHKLLDLTNAKRMGLENRRQEIAAAEKRFQELDPMLEKETRYQLVEEIRIKEMDISKLVELESRTRAWDPPRTERIRPEDLVKSAFSRNVVVTPRCARENRIVRVLCPSGAVGFAKRSLLRPIKLHACELSDDFGCLLW